VSVAAAVSTAAILRNFSNMRRLPRLIYCLGANPALAGIGVSATDDSVGLEDNCPYTDRVYRAYSESEDERSRGRVSWGDVSFAAAPAITALLSNAPQPDHVGDLDSPGLYALNLRFRLRFWSILPQAWLRPSQ
jgi:hypothetical protein